MNTIQLSIKASEAEQELLISQLSETATGFEQNSEFLLAYFPENNFNSYDITAMLQGYTFTSQVIEEQNWNALWESNFQPVVVDDFCAVRAHFHEPIQGMQHQILITPKMSFGTGHHATTYMMIQQMRSLDFKGKKVFDFGTGTGILAILAEMLGASEVQAIDIDEWSINNAEENSIQNNCSKIKLSLGTELPDDRFDIVLANINRNVILEYMDALPERLVGGGQLLLSGLLSSDEADIVKACEAKGFQFLHKQEKMNWISLLFVNAG